MLSEGVKGSKRREEVGTCCPLGVMVVEEPLGESELTGRARGGSFRDAFGLGDFKPKRLALGCPERPRLPPLFSQSSCCPGEYRECEGYCFGRLLPAASTLEEWRGRRVCFRAIGGRGGSLYTCPMSMVDAVLWRRNVKLHELTTKIDGKNKKRTATERRLLLDMHWWGSPPPPHQALCLLPSKLLPSNRFRSNCGLFIFSLLHHLAFQHSAATRG